VNWLVAHGRRELGEHRAVLLGLLIAIPVLVASAFVAFGGAGVKMATLLPEFVGGAALLAALSLATESFAGERSRGTIDGLRRLPGGLRRAWIGKLTFLPAAILAAAAWMLLCFTAACAVFPGTRAAIPEILDAIDARLGYGLLIALAFAAWVLLASTWVPRGATAVTLALGVPAVLLAPAFLLWGDDRPFLATLAGALPATLAVVALVGVVGSAIGWIRGLRHVGRLSAATLLCVPLVLGPTAAAYAWTRARHDAWMHVDPFDDDARIEAHVGRDGRYAFVNLHRGEAWTTNRPVRVDLRDGTTLDLAPVGTYVDAIFHLQRWSMTATRGRLRLGPTSGVGAGAGRTYLDGRTGLPIGALVDRPREPRLEALLRAEARRLASHRGPDGRLEWSLDGALERETTGGAVARLPNTVREGRTYNVWWQPWGWQLFTSDGGFALRPGADPATSAVSMKVDRKDLAAAWIDAGHYVCTHQVPRGAPRLWEVVDVAGGTRAAAPGFAPDDRNVLHAQDGRALVATGSDAPTLVAIDLTTGERRAVRAELPESVSLAVCYVYGVRDDGRLVLGVGQGGWTAEAGRFGLAVYDPARAVLDGFVETTPGASRSVLAFDGTEGAWAIDGGKRLVHLRWGHPEVEVVYPRR
jgi:hypothetical protein